MLNLVVATIPEAKPIIKFFNLKQNKLISEFKIFENYQKTISLIISGIGKINAASAVTYLALKSKNIKNNIWLNIGIAGGKENIGKLFMINKSIDHSSKKCWYPSFCFKTKIITKACKTFDLPVFKYENHLNDMELSGFFSASLRFSYNELIHSIKVISDNEIEKKTIMDNDYISKLIKPHIKDIEDIIIKLLIARSFVIFDDSIKNVANIYFAKNKLKKKEEDEILYLLYKWNLHKKKSIDIEYFSGKEILEVLRIKN